MRGTVAMKTSDTTAHVCLGENDVKVGDKLEFSRISCLGSGGGGQGGDSECVMELLGTGTVSKILGNHYSEVKTNKKFKFSKGTLVQKTKK